jgi:hypothetical protein
MIHRAKSRAPRRRKLTARRCVHAEPTFHPPHGACPSRGREYDSVRKLLLSGQGVSDALSFYCSDLHGRRNRCCARRDTADNPDATQQIVQQQIAQQQIDLINQQQLNQASVVGLGGYRVGVGAPRLQQQPGTEPGTVEVRMEDPSRGASIFYTTDGWTPTAASKRYVGPITIHQSVTLQAIAIVAGGLRSYVSVLPVQPGSGALTPQSSNALHIQTLAPGTHLPLVFAKTVTSQGKRVGDHLPVCLADDLFVNGQLAAPKGTSVEAIVTQVDNSHVQGLPGMLSFSVQSIRLEDGSTVSLLGVETMEGADHSHSGSE